MAKKGWKNVSLKESVVRTVQEHLEVTDKAKTYHRSVARFAVEAIENQITKERKETA